MPRVPKDSNSDPLVEATARVCLLPRCPGQVESVERDLASVSSRSFLLHRVQISSQQVYRLLLPPPARKSRPTGITSRTNLYEELCHQATPLGLAHGCHGADGHRYSLLPPPPFGYCATERLCLSVFSILPTQRSCQTGALSSVRPCAAGVVVKLLSSAGIFPLHACSQPDDRGSCCSEVLRDCVKEILSNVMRIVHQFSLRYRVSPPQIAAERTNSLCDLCRPE